MDMDTGFSVYVDRNKFKKKEDSIPNFLNNDGFKSALNSIYPKYINKWVDDSLIKNCQLCSAEFGWVTVKKHHCRACGCVFCYDCCNQSIKIPPFIKKPLEEASYRQQIVNFKYGYKKSDTSLVCNECYNKIKNLEIIHENILIAEFFDLETLFTMLHVSKKWYNASIHYLSKFREIQYRQSDSLYTSWELNILKLSENMLSGHSNWKNHLIKSSIQLYYKSGLLTEFASLTKPNILSSPKVSFASCWKLMCCRKCYLKLDILDYIEILKFVAIIDYTENLFWKSDCLKSILLKILNEICRGLNCDVLKNAMPLLCSVLSSLLNDFVEDIDKDFIKSFFNELSVCKEVIFYLYDEIQYLKTTNDGSMGIANLGEILNEYILETDSSLQDKINPISEKIKEMKINMSLLINKKTSDIKLPLIYPFDYNWQIIKINDCKVMKSNSAPILLSVTIKNAKKETKDVKFLIKKEASLRKEQLVSCIICLLLFRLNQHETLSNKANDPIPTYQIKMLSTDVGVIEFVENSMTLREITDCGFTLQNYILDHNKHEILDVTKKKFSNSLAISCCISYLLGLGDRHLDNIMINKKGHLFHIDYGYLLENPKTHLFGCPAIKITQQMVDFLSGSNSVYYASFKNYLIYVYDIMRLYKNIIVDYYEIMGNQGLINWNLIKDKLESRFMTGLVCKHIGVILTSEIESSNSMAGMFNDVLHTFGVEIKKRIS
jgi:hypothetical protein